MKKNIFFIFLFILYFLPAISQSTHFTRIELDYDTVTISRVSALGLAIDYIEANKFIWLELSEAEMALINSSGLSYRILIDNLEQYYSTRNAGKNIQSIMDDQRRSGKYTLPGGFSFGSMGGFCTYEELLAHLDTMHQLYPGQISARDSIPGGSTIEGRPVYWVRISNNPGVLQEKPRVLYTALLHAREPGSMQQMLYFMYYLLENYATNAEIKSLVDLTELYFVPAVNPDGYLYNQSTNPNGGGMWRKNRRENENGSMGVDLNRNFGYLWGFNNFGSSSNPASNTYRGTAPFSEPETQLMKTFCETYNFDIALNCHTYGNLLLHPWGYVSYVLTPDHDLFQEHGYLMTVENDYAYGVPGSLLYVINGDFNDWLYGEQTTKQPCIAFTPEVGTNTDGFWPPVERIIPQCEENLHQNIMAARLAGFYAELFDLTPANLSKQEGWIQFGVKRIGLNDLSYSVNITAINDVFIEIEQTKNYLNSALLEVEYDSVKYILKPDLKPGDEIKFAISLMADGFSHTDTITKLYGKGIEVLFDDCSTMNNWISSSWNISTRRFFSPSLSIGNAPVTFYPNNDSSAIILAQPVDLTNVICAWLSFYTSWDMNGGKDYVKLMASTDGGTTWTPLRGRMMEDNFIPGNPEVPVYRGKSNEWLKDWVSLRNWCGQSILLGFWFSSDATIGRSGFYFDDFKIEKLDNELSVSQINLEKGWNDMSGLVIPDIDSLEVILNPYSDDLIMVLNDFGSYQPGSAQNELVRWDATHGYFVKVENDFTLQLEGSKQTATILSLDAGWNLIPALTEEPCAVVNLTTQPPDKIIIIREAVGVKTYWPEQNISTLEFLFPKQAYLIKLSQPALLYFGTD